MYTYQRTSPPETLSSFKDQQREIFGYLVEHAEKIENYTEGYLFEEYQKHISVTNE